MKRTVIILAFLFLLPAAVRAESKPGNDTIYVYHKDTVYYLPADKRRDRRPRPQRISYPLRRPVLAFRSNLLMPLLNVGMDCPVGNGWSVAADFYYPWCPREWMNRCTSTQMNCIQLLGGYLEGRYRFGRQHPLLGHSIGIVAGASYYDLERDGAGQQGELFAAGIAYSYAFPLGKKGGVYLEVELAVGPVCHIWHPYNVYYEGGYLLRRKDDNGLDITSVRQWMLFPLKAGLSLVIPVFAK